MISRSTVSACLLAFGLAVGGCASKAESPAMTYAPPPGAASAIFAGGCFWCVEYDFEHVPGVYEVESGYTGGHTKNPTYYQVGSGATGHAEAVRVFYDPTRISYAQLVDYFWRHIDPTVKNRQFCDSGSEYRSAIFWQNESEKSVAESSRDALLASGRFADIHTEIVPASNFYRAEEYHQDYYKKNPLRYAYYRHGCGRDARVAEVWGHGPSAGAARP